MSSPDIRGPRKPKPHPACPGRSRCKIKGCIHNAPISRFSTDGIADRFGAYPSVRFAGGFLHQRLGATSQLVINVREIDYQPKARQVGSRRHDGVYCANED